MHNNNLPMINSLNNGAPILIDENEYMVMNCGAFNPRFLAKIKKSKAVHDKNKSTEKKSINSYKVGDGNSEEQKR